MRSEKGRSVAKHQVGVFPVALTMAMPPFTLLEAVIGPGFPCAQPPNEPRATDLGPRQVAGRNAHGYRIEGKAATGGPDRMTTWVDLETGIPLRIEYVDGTVMEYRSFRIGPPPAGLFEIPKDFQRVSF